MNDCPYTKRIFCPAFLLALLEGDCCPDCGTDTDLERDEPQDERIDG